VVAEDVHERVEPVFGAARRLRVRGLALPRCAPDVVGILRESGGRGVGRGVGRGGDAAANELRAGLEQSGALGCRALRLPLRRVGRGRGSVEPLLRTSHICRALPSSIMAWRSNAAALVCATLTLCLLAGTRVRLVSSSSVRAPAISTFGAHLRRARSNARMPSRSRPRSFAAHSATCAARPAACAAA
jgi:hypothetical protein